jgi:hypothetical protein
MPYLATKGTKPVRANNGTEFYYNFNKNQEKMDEAIKFFKGRIVSNEKLNTNAAVAGIYTWILRASGKIYASKIITNQETGTLHQNLDVFTYSDDASPIIAAGELEKKPDGTIYFNLLSGTYMAKKEFKKFKGESNEEYKIRAIDIRNELIKRIQRLLPNFIFLECSRPDCSIEDQVAGENIIEKTSPIITPKSNTNILNTFMIRKGGRRLKRTQKKKNKRRYKTHKKH